MIALLRNASLYQNALIYYTKLDLYLSTLQRDCHREALYHDLEKYSSQGEGEISRLFLELLTPMPGTPIQLMNKRLSFAFCPTKKSSWSHGMYMNHKVRHCWSTHRLPDQIHCILYVWPSYSQVLKLPGETSEVCWLWNQDFLHVEAME